MKKRISTKKRTTVWLPQKLVKKLKKLSRKTGAPSAELFRRALEAYLKYAISRKAKKGADGWKPSPAHV